MQTSRRRCLVAASGCSNSPYEIGVKAVSGKAFAKVVERKGWTLLRIAGSHHIYGKDGEVARLSIPIHGNRALKLGLQRSLIAIAGLHDSDF
jgi:predicted RNA binding protein YcfA (HicA-like mRNA interferase family)